MKTDNSRQTKSGTDARKCSTNFTHFSERLKDLCAAARRKEKLELEKENDGKHDVRREEL